MPTSEYVLQEHYWTHVEYFPYRPISQQLVKQLSNILRHAEAGIHILENSAVVRPDLIIAQIN